MPVRETFYQEPGLPAHVLTLQHLGSGETVVMRDSKHAIALPDGVTNIHNGVGYLGGVISKTFPYIDVEGRRGLFHFPCPTGRRKCKNGLPVILKNKIQIL